MCRGFHLILYIYFQLQAWLGSFHMGTYQAAILEATYWVPIFIYLFDLCISYSIYSFLALKATVQTDALPSEMVFFRCFKPHSTLNIGIPQCRVKGRIMYLSHWGKVFILIRSSLVLQDNFKYIYNVIKSCRNDNI